jgi:uncharacterized protein (TIGR03435 family)
MDKNGFPTIPGGGRGMMVMMMNGQMHLTAGQETISQFCDFLGSQFGRPVIDQTGLAGKYDFNLAYAPEGPVMGRGGMPPPPPPGTAPAGVGGGEVAGLAASNDPAPTLMAALQDQLGLKLETKKAPVDIVIVDYIEKTPTEN